MRILVPIHPTIRDAESIASLCKHYLHGVIKANRILIRMAKRAGKPIPDLYDSGIKFRAEPWAGQLDEFADVLTCMRRGWADCEDLVGIRVAQLRERGGPWLKSDVKIYWRVVQSPEGPQTIYHAQVREPDGKIDDPSRRMGG